MWTALDEIEMLLLELNEEVQKNYFKMNMSKTKIRRLRLGSARQSEKEFEICELPVI